MLGIAIIVGVGVLAGAAFRWWGLLALIGVFAVMVCLGDPEPGEAVWWWWPLVAAAMCAVGVVGGALCRDLLN